MRIKIEDGALFFDTEGSKLRADGPRMCEVPTLILLHGGPGFDHTTFKPAMSSLAEVAQIVYLDHRGQGRSERAGEERLRLNSWADAPDLITAKRRNISAEPVPSKNRDS